MIGRRVAVTTFARPAIPAGVAPGLEDVLKNRAEQEIVEVLALTRADCLVSRVNRAADDERSRRDAPRPGSGQRIAAEVNTVRASRQRDVEAIVHQHPRTCTRYRLDT